VCARRHPAPDAASSGSNSHAPASAARLAASWFRHKKERKGNRKRQQRGDGRRRAGQTATAVQRRRAATSWRTATRAQPNRAQTSEVAPISNCTMLAPQARTGHHLLPWRSLPIPHFQSLRITNKANCPLKVWAPN